MSPKVSEIVRNKNITMEQLRTMPWEQFVRILGVEPKEIKIKQGGKYYACLDVPYWDSEKKRSVHRRTTIGYYDAEGKRILNGSQEDTQSRQKRVPEKYAVTKEVGCALLLETVAHSTGLYETVKKVFPNNYEIILTCAYFMARCDEPLSHCEQWTAQSVSPVDDRLGDQRISELLPLLSGDKQKEFFHQWRNKLQDEDNYAIDITSISSYAQAIKIIRAGYNRDGEDLEQINLALMIGSKSMLPICYRIIPGNVNDSSSLIAFLRTLNAMGFKKFKLVMDKGFYTEENVNAMYRLRLKFTLSVPNGKKISSDAIKDVRQSIENFDNFLIFGSSEVYATTLKKKWVTDGANHRCYVHVYLDQRKRNDDYNHFIEKLHGVRKRIVEDGDEASICSPMAKKYLLIKKYDGKYIVQSNQQAIEEYRNGNAGFLVIISNHINNALDALRIYREKETAENGFDDMKNEIDFNRLRIRTEAALDGKTFIIFLSLILKSYIAKIIRGSLELQHHTRDEIMNEMSILKKVTIGGSKPIYSERTKLQKIVIREFGIPTNFRDFD